MSATTDYLVVGHFKNVDDTVNAIRSVREKGYDDIEVYTPYPNHDIEDELYKDRPRSPVRRCVLAAGLTGCLGAFLMTSWMSVDWPLRVSAKPLLSYPAFVVIGFECTILIAGIVNMLSMFHFSRLPNIFRSPGFRPEFTRGTFGFTVRVAKDKTDEVKSQLETGGAHQVEVQYVR